VNVIIKALLLSGYILASNNTNNNDSCKILDDIIIPQNMITKSISNYESERAHKFNCAELVIFKEKTGSKVIAINSEGAGSTEHFPHIFIFNINNIPKKLYNHCTLDVKGNQKSQLISIIAGSSAIESKYFATEKGLELGMDIDKVIKKYGKPDMIDIVDFKPKVLINKWEVFGYEDSNYFQSIPKQMICKEIPAKFRLYITTKNNIVEQIEMGYDVL